MTNFRINKDMTVSNIKSSVKASLIEEFIEFLKEKYGEDEVAMLRFGTSTSKKNEVGLRYATVECENGEINDVVVTFNPTVKEFANRKTDKKVYTAFDWEAAKNDYNLYVIDKNTKAAEKAAAKEKAIAKKKNED